MLIDRHINKDNWYEIKDILPDITEIKSLSLWRMGLTEFPKMSHITINGYFDCRYNKISSFKDCPIVNDTFWCNDNQITSFKGCPKISDDFHCRDNQIAYFKDCPEIGGILYSDFWIFSKVHCYSKEKKYLT